MRLFLAMTVHQHIKKNLKSDFLNRARCFAMHRGSDRCNAYHLMQVIGLYTYPVVERFYHLR